MTTQLYPQIRTSTVRQTIAGFRVGCGLSLVIWECSTTAFRILARIGSLLGIAVFLSNRFLHPMIKIRREPFQAVLGSTVFSDFLKKLRLRPGAGCESAFEIEIPAINLFVHFLPPS